jgi:hypothetical protein
MMMHRPQSLVPSDCENKKRSKTIIVTANQKASGRVWAAPPNEPTAAETTAKKSTT